MSTENERTASLHEDRDTNTREVFWWAELGTDDGIADMMSHATHSAALAACSAYVGPGGVVIEFTNGEPNQIYQV